MFSADTSGFRGTKSENQLYGRWKMGLYSDCPCKDCVPPKRHELCHSTCPDKKAWDEKKKAAIDAIKAEKDRHIEATGFIVDSQLRVARRLKLNKWK